MFPHERSLVKRLEGKPFVLLGVNGDSNRGQVKEAIREEGITWRSWWDDGSRSGPIAELYQVQVTPTVYIIDAKGIIRRRFVDATEFPTEKAINTVVDKLLAEMAAQ